LDKGIIQKEKKGEKRQFEFDPIFDENRWFLGFYPIQPPSQGGASEPEPQIKNTAVYK